MGNANWPWLDEKIHELEDSAVEPTLLAQIELLEEVRTQWKKNARKRGGNRGKIQFPTYMWVAFDALSQPGQTSISWVRNQLIDCIELAVLDSSCPFCFDRDSLDLFSLQEGLVDCESCNERFHISELKNA